MWLDRSGVAHTAALPDPSELFGPDTLEWLAGLSTDEQQELLALIEQATDDLFEADLVWSPGEGQFVGQAPAAGVVGGDLRSHSEFVSFIDHVDTRWRLDVLLALEDLLTSS